MRTLWIGTYPPAGIGTPPSRGEGIYRVRLDPRTGALDEPVRLVETPAPSFVAAHPAGAAIYATDESEPGAVAAFRVHDDGLELLGTAASGGAYPCHLAVDGDRLYAANYGDGALGVLALAPDGSFASDEPVLVLRHAGSGPNAERQGGPHAHFVAPAPGGHLLVVDLGTDEIRRYARTPAGLRPAGLAATLPPGTGPRHLAFGSGGRRAYVSGELDATVHVLAWDPTTDTGTPLQTLPALARYTSSIAPMPSATALPSGEGADRRAAWAVDIAPMPSHVALDGDELVVGVRGVGLLARFGLGADGVLTRRAEQPLPGRIPRHFAVVDGWTVVAEQVPGAVTVLHRDGTVVASVPVPSAVCVTPAW